MPSEFCKEYHSTGCCKYGQGCKYPHISKFEVEEPHICSECKQSTSAPCVSECRHLYCEGCLSRYPKLALACSVCGEETLGRFWPV
ncbi:hypothetical protein PAPHI01_1245 [Pancytospora philotis]|nr:hypothetical protein PAPHI01_1245 [Pancytospora philotis]